MWKYVSRRIRDTFERSVAQFENRSTVGVVNSSSSSDEKSLCTPSRWFSSYKCLSSCRNDGTNSKRWNFEHRTWIDAITWVSLFFLQIIFLLHKLRVSIFFNQI